VFQRLVSLSEGTPYFEELIALVAENKENLKVHKFGRKIISKIMQTYPETETALGGRARHSFNSGHKGYKKKDGK